MNMIFMKSCLEVPVVQRKLWHLMKIQNILQMLKHQRTTIHWMKSGQLFQILLILSRFLEIQKKQISLDLLKRITFHFHHPHLTSNSARTRWGLNKHQIIQKIQLKIRSLASFLQMLLKILLHKIMKFLVRYLNLIHFFKETKLYASLKDQILYIRINESN